MLLSRVTIDSLRQHLSTVIFLHGLGDSGNGWSSLGYQLRNSFPNTKFVFPNAPEQAVTLNGGMFMPSWYDITTLNKDEPHDEHGMMQSRAKINELIDHELSLGITPNKIILGGFSQGCVLSLLTGLMYKHTIGGLLCLSGYMPLHDKFKTIVLETNKNVPIFFGHGEDDQVVSFEYGKKSVEELVAIGHNVTFRKYANMGHSFCDQELKDLLDFLNKINL